MFQKVKPLPGSSFPMFLWITSLKPLIPSFQSLVLAWILGLALYLTPQQVLAQAQQSPYEITWAKGLAITGIGGVTIGLGHKQSRRLQGLTDAELDALESGKIWAIDRFAIRQSNQSAKIISDITGYGAFALPFSLLAYKPVQAHALDAGAIYGQVLLLNTGLTMLSKNSFRRSRPYVYNPHTGLLKRRSRDARRSFFSGHTSNAAANSFYSAQVLLDFRNSSKGEGWVWASAALLPTITGTTRVLSGNHYWTDVLVGYAIGAGIGVLLPRLYR